MIKFRTSPHCGLSTHNDVLDDISERPPSGGFPFLTQNQRCDIIHADNVTEWLIVAD